MKETGNVFNTKTLVICGFLIITSFSIYATLDYFQNDITNFTTNIDDYFNQPYSDFVNENNNATQSKPSFEIKNPLDKLNEDLDCNEIDNEGWKNNCKQVKNQTSFFITIFPIMILIMAVILIFRMVMV